MGDNLTDRGFNNTYLCETFDLIALKYNDKAVLESYHAASSFVIADKKKFNFLNNLSRDTKKDFRVRMIGMILATDMAEHFKEMGRLKAKLS